MLTAEDPPAQNQNAVQAQTKPLHSGVVVMINYVDDRCSEMPCKKMSIGVVHTAV